MAPNRQDSTPNTQLRQRIIHNEISPHLSDYAAFADAESWTSIPDQTEGDPSSDDRHSQSPTQRIAEVFKNGRFDNPLQSIASTIQSIKKITDSLILFFHRLSR